MAFNRRSKKSVNTTVNTSTETTIRDVGFTGAQGVELAFGLANAGLLANQEAAATIENTNINTLEATGKSGQQILESTGIASGNILETTSKASEDILGFGSLAIDNLFDDVQHARVNDSQNLKLVAQSNSDGFNRLLGGASELIESSATIAESNIESSEDVLGRSVDAGEATFKRIVDAARGLAGDLTQGSTAFVEGATRTIERLGPQTQNNQNIAFAGLAVAAIAVGFVMFNRRKS